jgi:hypothetical protein
LIDVRWPLAVTNAVLLASTTTVVLVPELMGVLFLWKDEGGVLYQATKKGRPSWGGG